MKKNLLSLMPGLAVVAALLIANAPAHALTPAPQTPNRIAPQMLGKGLQPAYLRCEYLVNPLGIGETAPRLSWVVESGERGQSQSAYRILVASSEKLLARETGDLWDTGKIASDETTSIVYAGAALASGQKCFWKIMVWNARDLPSAWSSTASWSMGLLQASDWQAQWIGAAATTNNLPPPALLRTQFKTAKTVTRATLYAAALGLADLQLNGQRVNADYFSSGWTDYTKRVYYRTYDVTAAVRKGDNALGAILADGWFSGYVGYGHRRNHYGKSPRLLAQLVLEFADGSRQVVATGPDWKTATGPTRTADFLQGETYDAAKEISGWDKADFKAKGWTNVATGAEVNPLVQAHPGPPVVAAQEFTARSITQPKPGVYVFDLGQNFAGITRLTVRGKAGQKITIRHAERLNPDGTAYTKNLRGAAATDVYLCKGKGAETWSPRFTFHGFQYVEVTGLTEKPTAETIVGVALSSGTPIAGAFECSSPMLNQLHNNVYWTQRANFIDIPTDCPQRDERLGWTGDAQVYVRTATLNTDVQSFFTKWLVDLDDAQRADGQFPCVAPLKVAGGDGGPAWADAGVICPWTIYEVYGDKRQLAQHYPAMQHFIEFCGKRCTPELVPPAKFHCFGDWLNINAETPKDVLYIAYYAYSTKLLARAAETLGKPDDAVKYFALFDQIKAAFNRNYVAPDGRIKGDTQTAYVLAIQFDLLDGENLQRAADYLVADIQKRDWHLSTGFIGTKDLMLALAKAGRNDVAYRLLHNDTFPSWGFSIKHGATSIWERWNGWTPEQGFGDPGMNSFAHYSFGAVYQWMVENIGGIRNDGPAYHRITITPTVDDKLAFARVVYDSIRGNIRSEWKKTAAGVTYNIVIPANTTATISLAAAAETDITESGLPLNQVKDVKVMRSENGRVQLAATSGSYTFEVKSAK